MSENEFEKDQSQMKDEQVMNENRNKRSDIVSTVITSIICLLPIAIGLILWNKLPETMVRHWGFNGQPDGYSSKFVCVVVFPVLLTFLQIFMVITLFFKKETASKKFKNVYFWIIPMASVIVSFLMYALNLGIQVNIFFWVNVFVSLLFMVLGNILPKSPVNQIKVTVPHAIKDDENKVASMKKMIARRYGLVLFIAGLFMLVTSFTPFVKWTMLGGIGFIILGAIVSAIITAIQFKKS